MTDDAYSTGNSALGSSWSVVRCFSPADWVADAHYARPPPDHRHQRYKLDLVAAFGWSPCHWPRGPRGSCGQPLRGPPRAAGEPFVFGLGGARSHPLRRLRPSRDQLRRRRRYRYGFCRLLRKSTSARSSRGEGGIFGDDIGNCGGEIPWTEYAPPTRRLPGGSASSTARTTVRRAWVCFARRGHLLRK